MINSNWKDVTQYTSAVAAIASGIVLSFMQYVGYGDLSTGVLTYVGQMLIYAGGIFGVTMYWNGKYVELKSMIKHGDTSMDSSSLENAR